MRVLVVHQTVGPEASQDDKDVLVQAGAVADSLVRLGHEAIIQPAGHSPADLYRLVHRTQPDVVFNLVESFFGKDFFQWWGAGILTELGVPFTGCAEDALFLTGDKLITKSILRATGLPTPEWIVPDDVARDWLACWEESCLRAQLTEDDAHREDSPIARVFYNLQKRHAGHWHHVTSQDELIAQGDSRPAFLQKGAWSHASAGLIEQLWVIVTRDDLWRLREQLSRRSQQSNEPWFAERYIEGREFNLSLIAGERGPIVFPPAEIDFSAFPPEKLKIVGYSAKWDADSFEYVATPRRFVFPAEDQPLLLQLEALARQCWQVFGLRGYARIDFRVDAAGQPWILEINTNPCLSPDAGFAAAAAEAGWSFDRVTEAILADALRAAGQTAS
ncbi:MAG TPA: hypothetical protein PLO20_05435 [Thermogutta sp.]|nr:hypothetical protein [Thermogutta sp.]